MRQEETPITQSEYHKALDEAVEEPPKLSTQTVRYWSDFTRIFYHPRSIVHINDYEIGSTILPFEQWSNGGDLFNSLDREHDLLDRDVRPWAEECDQMQGIQIFASADDAWGGFASRYVESLKDEYGKTPIWFWGLEDVSQNQRSKQMLRNVNIAQSLQAIATTASMYIPLAVPSYLPPYIRIDPASQWHIAGLLSIAVESITLPSRQKPNCLKRGLLSDMESSLNVNGNQVIAELQCSLGKSLSHLYSAEEAPEAAGDFRTSTSVMYEDELGKADAKLDMVFSTGRPSQTAFSLRQWEKANHVFGKVGSLRGIPLPKPEIDEEDRALSRKRRRLACLPVIEKYVCSWLGGEFSSADNASQDTTIRYLIPFLTVSRVFSRKAHHPQMPRSFRHLYRQQHKSPNGPKGCRMSYRA